MKKLIIFTLLAICVAVFFSCYTYQEVIGSGVLVNRELAYVDFDSIEMRVDGDITIVPSSEFGITLTADDNIIDLVTVYPADGGGTLRFEFDRAYYYRQASVEIEVRMPTLDNLVVDSRDYGDHVGSNAVIEAGFASLDVLSVVNLDGSIDLGTLSATQIDIEHRGDSMTGEVTCDEINIDLDGNGMDLSGSAQRLNVETGYYTDSADLSGLVVAVADVSIFNHSEISIHVTDVLTGFVDINATLTFVDVAGLDATGLVVEVEETVTAEATNEEVVAESTTPQQAAEYVGSGRNGL
jgi:hypothetical protein